MKEREIAIAQSQLEVCMDVMRLPPEMTAHCEYGDGLENEVITSGDLLHPASAPPSVAAIDGEYEEKHQAAHAAAVQPVIQSPLLSAVLSC